MGSEQLLLTAQQLLGIDGTDSVSVTIQGRGRSIVAGALKAVLTRDRVVSAIREGFFPLVPTNARPESASRVGLQEFGLPYSMKLQGVLRVLYYSFLPT